MKKIWLALFLVLLLPLPSYALELCGSCGVVSDIQVVRKKEGNVGSVVGALAGGILGNQVGHGDPGATVVGAVAGAVAGHLGADAARDHEWHIAITMRDGDVHTFIMTSDPGLRAGDLVRVAEDGNHLVPYPGHHAHGEEGRYDSEERERAMREHEARERESYERRRGEHEERGYRDQGQGLDRDRRGSTSEQHQERPVMPPAVHPASQQYQNSVGNAEPPVGYPSSQQRQNNVGNAEPPTAHPAAHNNPTTSGSTSATNTGAPVGASHSSTAAGAPTPTGSQPHQHHPASNEPPQ